MWVIKRKLQSTAVQHMTALRYVSVWYLPTAPVIALVIIGHFHLISPAAFWTPLTEEKVQRRRLDWLCICIHVNVCVWQMMIITKPTSPWSKTTTNHSTALSLILLITSHKSDGPWVMPVYPRKAHYRSLGSRDIIKVQMVLVCVCTQNLWERCAAENARFVSTCLSWP